MIDKLVEIARKEIGYTERPANTNMTKYGAEYGLNGYAWCCQYLWWIFKEAGLSSLFYGGGKTASCTQLRNWYKKRGLYSTGNPKVGDIVIMSFEAGGGISHCGLCIEVMKDGGIRTIEGNTSVAGSQDNGGMVAVKRRYPKNIVGYCHPAYPVEDDEMLSYEQFSEYMAKYEAEKAAKAPDGYKVFAGYMERYEAERAAKTAADWSAEAREWAVNGGIIQGDGNGAMRWKDPITREEYAVTEYRQNKSKKSTAKKAAT